MLWQMPGSLSLQEQREMRTRQWKPICAASSFLPAQTATITIMKKATAAATMTGKKEAKRTAVLKADAEAAAAAAVQELP